jgi:hypothetical protein
VFCSKDCPNTLWRPGLLVTTSPAGGSDLPGDDSCVMLIQRAPGDDGWLAISESGIVFNIFDSIARLYHTAAAGATGTSGRRSETARVVRDAARPVEPQADRREMKPSTLLAIAAFVLDQAAVIAPTRQEDVAHRLDRSGAAVTSRP